MNTFAIPNFKLKMARDKAKDDLMFNCSQDWELDYVACLYGKDAPTVKDFLQRNCQKGNIKNRTHREVYGLVKEYLGLSLN